MPSAKLAAAIVVSALSLSACGVSSKPEAGTPKAIANGHKGLDDPRIKHTACLEQAHIPFIMSSSRSPARSCPSFQVGTAPAGPTVSFEPTPGDAQGMQIQGEAQGAEIIGSARRISQPGAGRPDVHGRALRGQGSLGLMARRPVASAASASTTDFPAGPASSAAGRTAPRAITTLLPSRNFYFGLVVVTLTIGALSC